MKKLITSIILALAMSSVLFSNLQAQTTKLKSYFQEMDSVELDRFLYADTVSGALAYEFWVQQADSGVNRTITKNVNYFTLNELDEDAMYGLRYKIRVRCMVGNDTTAWGDTVNVYTVDNKLYRYGFVRIQFKQSEYFKYLSFFDTDSIVSNSEIPYFNQLSAFAGIVRCANVNQKLLELTDRNSGSCFDLIFNETFSVDSIISFFNSTGAVEYAIPHYTANLSLIPNDYNATGDVNSDGIYDVWHLTDVSAPDAWNIVTGDIEHVVIAVADNVFNIDHEDIIDNIYVNMGEIPPGVLTDQNGNGVIDGYDLLQHYPVYSTLHELFGAFSVNYNADPNDDISDAIFNGVDDDGNYRIDDICGWDFADDDNDVTPASTSGNYLSHGTYTSSIIGQKTHNGTGTCALSYNIRVLPMKFASDNQPYVYNNSYVTSSIADYLLGLTEKPKALSMSFAGFDQIQDFETGLALLEDEFNIVSIAATGNNGYNVTSTPVYPAFYDNVVKVGASNRFNERCGFSNYGNIGGTYVIAPGEEIYMPAAGDVDNGINDQYGVADGTSLACPLVASMVGLLYSYNPLITPEIVRLAIECGCDNNPNQLLYYNSSNDGFGKINAYQSLLCLSQMQPIAAISSSSDYYCPGTEYIFDANSVTSLGSCTYQWSVTGGSYSISGGNTSEHLHVVFNDQTTYTVTVIITNINGASNPSSIQVVVAYPEISILNGNNFQTCEGYNTTIFIQMEGTSPFNFGYSFNGSTVTPVSNVADDHYQILLTTSSFDEGSTGTFTITYFNDNSCAGNTTQTTFTIGECQFCGQYNSVMHFNPGGSNCPGLLFDPVPNLVDNPFNPITSSGEGPASITDYFGQPILSASGGFIYCTKAGCSSSPLNSTPIISNISATQGQLILPHPSNDSQYFVIFIDDNGSGIVHKIAWRIVDFSTSNCGTILPGGQFLNHDVEKLTACRIVGENGYWILTHSDIENTFNIYKLTDVSSTITYVGSEMIGTSTTPTTAGEMKFDISQNTLAVAFQADDRVDLYEFNRDASFSGNRLTLLGSQDIENPYSVEFSPNGDYLYVANFDELLQIPTASFNMQNPTVIYSAVPGSLGPTSLRLGPDMKLYVGHYPYIDVINNPNVMGMGCNLISNVFEIYLMFSMPQRIPLSRVDFTLESSTENCVSEILVNNLGGEPPFTYQWSNNEISESLTNVEPGTYSLTVTSAYGCTNSDEITVDYVPLEFTNIAVHNTCYPLNDGLISVSVDGGNSPYNFHWENETGNTIGNQSTITGLNEGLYYLTVTDYNNCTISLMQNIYLSYPPELEINITQICEEGSGSAEVIVTNEFPPFDYLWSNGETSSIITVDEPGTYTVTVTDNNGCSTVGEVEIIDATPVAAFKIDPECFAVDYLPLEFEAHLYDPANTYLWDFGDGSTGTGEAPEHEYLYDGYYCVTLTVSNGYCTSSTSERIYINPAKCVCGYDYNLQNNIIIDEDTEWIEVNYSERNNIIIRPGVELRITKYSIVRFGPEGRIIVEPDGILTVDGFSTLTSLDEDCNYMWQGIEVWSTTNSHAGKVILSDATIENAHIAVLIGQRNLDYICEQGVPINSLNTYGHVNADRTNFYDNAVGIYDVFSYHPKTHEISVTNCIFKATQLIDPAYNINHPSPYSPTVNTYGTYNFNPRNPWAYQANELGRGYCGIRSYMRQNIYCENNSYMALIHGVELGQTALQDESSQYYDCVWGITVMPVYSSLSAANRISGSYFNILPGPEFPNIHGGGIYIGGGISDVIKECTFGDVYNSQQSDNNMGVGLFNSSSFRVIDNDFVLFRKGVRVYNSSNGGGYVGIGRNSSPWYGNSFLKCNINIMTQSNNSALRLRCNSCNNPDELIYTVNFQNSGLLNNQGFAPGSGSWLYNLHRRPAGNQFEQQLGPDDYTRHEIESGIPSYTYVYHKHDYDANSWRIVPISPNSSVGLYEYEASHYIETESCKPLLNIVIDIADELSDLMEDNVTDFGYITSILDNGNTGYLLAEIERHCTGDSLMYILCDNSPLSDTVLYAFMTNDSVTDSEFAQVIGYNTPVSHENEYWLRQRLALVQDTTIVDKTMQNQAYNPSCTTQTSCLREYRSNYAMFREVLGQLLEKYLGNQETDSVMFVLNTYDDNYNKELAFGWYFDLDSVNQCRQILNGYTPANIEEQNWLDLMGIYIDNLEAQKAWFDLDSAQWQSVRAMARQCPGGRAAEYARNLLSMVFGIYFTPCDYTPAPRSMVIKPKTYGNDALSMGNPFPNPCYDKIWVPYFCPAGEIYRVEICDITGRVLISDQLKAGNNVYPVFTSMLSPGTYLIRIANENGSVKTKRFVKQQ
ncbi:MAG: S8 family serine peptidase [Bacteroidales bacterium]|nr:S8 family serine peptidase [Bacteroidales bacterium]